MTLDTQDPTTMEQFEQTDLTEGPRALRKAGLRSYIAFDREVRKQMINARTRIN